jgi:sulfur-oxidizing protein SoxY
MRLRTKILILDRRSFLASAAAMAALMPLVGRSANGEPAKLERSKKFADAFAQVLRGVTPVEDKVTVDLPELAENGNFVPITVQVDSPMSEADHVKTIHLLSTANPHARVATFHLSPINAVARIQRRMRLAKTQDVIVLAELSTGQILMSTTLVKVTIGGCGD